MTSHPLKLILFVMGSEAASVRSALAIKNVRAVVGPRLSQGVELQIIDVLERPDLAESYRIMATPTLVRQYPLPANRLIGDMGNHAMIENLLRFIVPLEGDVAGKLG